MIAIIMAGGKGKRFGSNIEKPLIEIEGKTILERVSIVLKNSGMNEIFVAVTDSTPKTKIKAEELKLKIIQTPGKGYIEDIQYLMKIFEKFLAVSADLPFLSSDLITNILAKYKKIKHPISVVVPKKDYEKMGLTPTMILNGFVPVGVNIVAIGKDYLYVTKGKETININTKKELNMIIK